MCHRRLDVKKSGKELIDYAHQRKNGDLRRQRPDGETQVLTIPKQVLRIQLQPREQIVEVPIVLHSNSLSKIHSCDCGSHCAGSPLG